MLMPVLMLMLMLLTRRQEQALQEAFRRADNSSEGKLTVDDYLKVTTTVFNYFLRMTTIMLKVLQDNRLTATKEEISMMMDIADKNKDG